MRWILSFTLFAMVSVPMASWAIDAHFYVFAGVCQPINGAVCADTATSVPKKVCTLEDGEGVVCEVPFPSNVLGVCNGGGNDGQACDDHSDCAGVSNACLSALSWEAIVRINSTTTSNQMCATAQFQITPVGADWGANDGLDATAVDGVASVTAAANDDIAIAFDPMLAFDQNAGVPCSPNTCKNSPGILRIERNDLIAGCTSPDSAAWSIVFINPPFPQP